MKLHLYDKSSIKIIDLQHTDKVAFQRMRFLFKLLKVIDKRFYAHTMCGIHGVLRYPTAILQIEQFFKIIITKGFTWGIIIGRFIDAVSFIHNLTTYHSLEEKYRQHVILMLIQRTLSENKNLFDKNLAKSDENTLIQLLQERFIIHTRLSGNYNIVYGNESI